MDPQQPARSRFIDHDGQRIILLDFSGITDPEVGLAEIARARAFIGQQTRDGSHFTLTDVTRTHYDRRIIDAMKEMTVHNRPFIKAAAIVSDSALHRAAISMLAVVSRRRLEVVDSREKGLTWLAKQR